MAKKRRKKAKPIEIPRIDLILSETHDSNLRDLLIELKTLNSEAFKFMNGAYKVAKVKYNELQKTWIWERAKHLLLQYFILTNQFQCHSCKTRLDSRFCTLHHIKYKWSEIFTPEFVCFIHHRCHQDFHGK